MKKLMIASVIAILSSLPLILKSGLGSPTVNHILDAITILSLPGASLAHTLSAVGSNYPDVVNSPSFVFVVSVVANTLMYWGVFSLGSAVFQ
jgi:hypothetical protein